MMQTAPKQSHSHGFFDKLAIGMAGVCAVHCLLTPVLIALLPILTTSFFVHKDFHLWMLFAVLPTTGLSIFMGCRKHKSRIVAILSLIGVSLLVTTLIYERAHASTHQGESAAEHSCADCSRDLAEAPLPTNKTAWINTLGGLFLVGAHARNYRLCRRQRCCHTD